MVCVYAPGGGFLRESDVLTQEWRLQEESKRELNRSEGPGGMVGEEMGAHKVGQAVAHRIAPRSVVVKRTEPAKPVEGELGALT